MSGVINALSRILVGIMLRTHRPQSSSFWGLLYRILNMNPKKELLWGLWVYYKDYRQMIDYYMGSCQNYGP